MDARGVLQLLIAPLGLVAFRRNREQLPEPVRRLLVDPLHPVPMMRLGNTGDGGYYVPRLLDRGGILISAGIGDDWSFDSDFKYFNPSARVIGIDPGLAAAYPFPGLRRRIAGHTDANTVSLERILLAETGPIVLKLDVEGSEYGTILAVPDKMLASCGVIVLEVHELNRLLDPSWTRYVFEPFASKLTQQHVVIARGANNASTFFYYDGHSLPKTLELTLILRDYMKAF